MFYLSSSVQRPSTMKSQERPRHPWSQQQAWHSLSVSLWVCHQKVVRTFTPILSQAYLILQNIQKKKHLFAQQVQLATYKQGAISANTGSLLCVPQASVIFPMDMVGPRFIQTICSSKTRNSETSMQMYWNLFHIFEVNGCLEFGEWWVC